MQARINTYLSFDNGQAREAMEFYKSVFGGELVISTFADQHVPDKPADGVMHAQLEVDGKPILMGSDGLDTKNIQSLTLALGGDNAEELRGYFQKLSQGGQVTQELKIESWGDEFGIVIDKFGITWMVNISAANSQK